MTVATTEQSHSCLLAELTAIVRKSAKISPRVPISPSSRLVEDLAIDSLDLVNLVLELQDSFGVAIEEDALPNLCKIGDLAAYLTRRVQANHSRS
jgi:acyl carrier protein